MTTAATNTLLHEALTIARRRLRTNAIAWHTKFHERRVEFEDCDISSCTNDQDALALIDTALTYLPEESRV